MPIDVAHFAGKDVDLLDAKRLTGQLIRVREIMYDQEWRTLAEIVELVGGSEAGVSARLRDLRKVRFGSHEVKRRRRGGKGGLWEYCVVPNHEII
jgi:hypothetical protein